MLKKSTVVALSLTLVMAATATVAVRAQQSPSMAPVTGAAPPPQGAYVPTAYVQPATYVQPVAPPQPAAGDPYGFTAWLNATRASYGLPSVGYDPNLANWASANNSQQAARGMGHYVMGPARRQNSAMGHYASIGAMWMGSPAHRAALLDPNIRFVGIAGMGAYWTFNAY